MRANALPTDKWWLSVRHPERGTPHMFEEVAVITRYRWYSKLAPIVLTRRLGTWSLKRRSHAPTPQRIRPGESSSHASMLSYQP